jgi:hypothetical protein
MNKMITSLLLFSSFASGLSAKNAHYFAEQKRLTISQTDKEKKDGVYYAKSEANATSTFCSFLFGGAIAGLGIVIGSEKNKPEFGLAGVLGGIATGIITYSVMYPEQEKQALEKYRDYAPMNDNLQRTLYNASTYNCNLLDIAQRVADTNIFVKEIAIQSADRSFPTIDAYNDLKAMLSYLESAEKEFKQILNNHNNLSSLKVQALRNFMYDAKNTERIIKEIMVTVKVTPFYRNELEDKRRADLYNAECNRIQAETHAASERARRERAERERARQEASLASIQTTQAWVNLFAGKPKKEEIHVHL